MSHHETPHLGVSAEGYVMARAPLTTPTTFMSLGAAFHQRDVQRACFTWSHPIARVPPGEYVICRISRRSCVGYPDPKMK